MAKVIKFPPLGKEANPPLCYKDDENNLCIYVSDKKFITIKKSFVKLWVNDLVDLVLC